MERIKTYSKLSLRIAIDLTPLYPGGKNGGAKTLILNLIKQFQTLAPNWEILLLTASWNHPELSEYENDRVKCLLIKDEPIENYLVKTDKKKYYSLIKKVLLKIKTKLTKWVINKNLLKQNRVNLLFCPFSDPTYAENNIPLVAIVHDLQHLDYPKFFSNQERKHRSRFFAILLKKAKKIICVSEFTRQSLIKHLNAQVDKLTVVHNCVHKRWNGLSEQEIETYLSEFDLTDRDYVFYPANYWPHKNHRMLLEAYKTYNQKFSNHCLDLVFTGTLESEEQALREAASIMGISDRVHFLGFVNEKALEAIWRRCKCLVFPSLYEGFGIPVLEAMQFGKPILCSNAASLPEVAGDAALYFDPQKPEELVVLLEKISSDRALINDLVDKGDRRLKFFDQDDMVRQYIKIFEEAILN